MTDENGRFGPPIDLAREADFTLGTLLVVPSAREAVQGATRTTLEPRVMQVLVALYQADGRVVPRDELIARCWEGRIVGEDAINRAMGRLRRLEAKDSFTVETIARVGFRLRAADAEQPSGDNASAPAPQAAPAPAKPGRAWLIVAAGAALVLAAAGAAAWLLWPAPHWTVESSRPFIFSLALEDYPAFSRDGAMLAYSSGAEGGRRQIYVRSLAGGDPIKLTADATDDISPSWSSDGAHLAYVAIKPGEPCRIMVAAFPAGVAREVGRCHAAASSTVAWQPGTALLYFTERAGIRGDALYRLDLDSGAEQVIVQEPALRDIITSLRCSPDGKWLVYLLRGDTIVIRDLAGGDKQAGEKSLEKSLGSIATRGAWSSRLAWSDDSRTVLASITAGIGGSQVMAFPMDASPPYRVYATELNIGHIAAGGGMLAIQTDTSRMNLARAGADPAAAPDIIDASNGLTWSPTFAPDGTMAFLSNRSGTNAIWLSRPGAAAPVQLLDLGFTPVYRIRYSPDGTRLAMAIETTESVVVKILTANGATLTTFNMPSLGLGLPTWTPDGKAIFVFDLGPKQTFHIDVDNPARRYAFAAPHWVGITLYNGGAYATRVDQDGVWRIDGPAPVRVSDKYPRYYEPPLAFLGDAVLVPHFEPGGPARILAQPLAGGPERFVAYAPGAANPADYQSSLTVNPKTGEILYTIRVAHDTNIDLLTLTRR